MPASWRRIYFNVNSPEAFRVGKIHKPSRAQARASIETKLRSNSASQETCIASSLENRKDRVLGGRNCIMISGLRLCEIVCCQGEVCNCCAKCNMPEVWHFLSFVRSGIRRTAVSLETETTLTESTTGLQDPVYLRSARCVEVIVVP